MESQPPLKVELRWPTFNRRDISQQFNYVQMTLLRKERNGREEGRNKKKRKGKKRNEMDAQLKHEIPGEHDNFDERRFCN